MYCPLSMEQSSKASRLATLSLILPKLTDVSGLILSRERQQVV